MLARARAGTRWPSVVQPCCCSPNLIQIQPRPSARRGNLHSGPATDPATDLFDPSPKVGDQETLAAVGLRRVFMLFGVFWGRSTPREETDIRPAPYSLFLSKLSRKVYKYINPTQAHCCWAFLPPTSHKSPGQGLWGYWKGSVDSGATHRNPAITPTKKGRATKQRGAAASATAPANLPLGRKHRRTSADVSRISTAGSGMGPHSHAIAA